MHFAPRLVQKNVDLIMTKLTHLAKRPNDLKQNGTQEKTPFSGTNFHTVSHGVLHFVASVIRISSGQ